MVPALCANTAAVPPPSYQRAVQKQPTALHITALTVVTTLRLLDLCRLAVRLAHQRCPPPLPKGPGGRRRTYSEESLLLIALLRALWRLSYADMRDWLRAWPELALACGLPRDRDGRPRVPSPSQQCKRAAVAGAPPYEMLLVVAVREALRCGLTRARDLIIDSAPILAWRRRDPDAASGHAPAHHPTAFLRGFRAHTLLCRGSGLPLFVIVAPANCHDAPFAKLLLLWAVRLYDLRPRRVRMDAAYWGLAPHPLDPHHPRRGRGGPLEPQAQQDSRLPAPDVDPARARQTERHRALLRAGLPLLRPPAPTGGRLDGGRAARYPDLRGDHRRGAGRPPRRPTRPHPRP